MAKTGEFNFIAQIQQQFSASQDFVSLGIGDDAAAFIPSRGDLSLLTTDTLIENTHFRREHSSFEQVGLKAVAVNLSDIAAMGGRPRSLLISLGVPACIGLSDLKQLYRGITKACRLSDLALIGGNTTRTSGPFFIAVMLHGEVSKKQMITRSGAKPGDAIYVTGTLGDAAAGLECLQSGVIKGNRRLIRAQKTPEARTTEGQAIAQAGIASAMIDISDGLSADLNHIMTQSGVGAALSLAQIPLSPALTRYSKKTNKKALDFALFGGEDYELLFSVSPGKAKKLSRLIECGLIQATQIGEILPKKEGLLVEEADGRRRKITAKGFDHFLERS